MKKYYKAELPKELENRFTNHSSILRTTANGDYNYAHFDCGLCFSNKPSSKSKNYNAIEITKEEHATLKKSEKAKQNKLVTIFLADSQQGIIERTVERRRVGQTFANYNNNHIRHFSHFQKIKEAKQQESK